MSVNLRADGTIYSSSEHVYQTKKAKYVRDFELKNLMLKQTDPFILKRMGCVVKNFNKSTWKRVSKRYMHKACSLKFTQNSMLLDYLICTKGIVAECTRYDKFWGTGVDMVSPTAICPLKWPGENHMGKILVEIRNELLSDIVE